MWAERKGFGEVLIGDYLMRVEPGGNVRTPDVRLVTTENLHRLGENMMIGPCAAAIEIISPSTARLDRVVNFRSGVIDGVFIDPDWLWGRPPVDDVLAKWQAEAVKGA